MLTFSGREVTGGEEREEEKTLIDDTTFRLQCPRAVHAVRLDQCSQCSNILGLFFCKHLLFFSRNWLWNRKKYLFIFSEEGQFPLQRGHKLGTLPIWFSFHCIQFLSLILFDLIQLTISHLLLIYTWCQAGLSRQTQTHRRDYRVLPWPGVEYIMVLA